MVLRMVPDRYSVEFSPPQFWCNYCCWHEYMWNTIHFQGPWMNYQRPTKIPDPPACSQDYHTVGVLDRQGACVAALSVDRWTWSQVPELSTVLGCQEMTSRVFADFFRGFGTKSANQFLTNKRNEVRFILNISDTGWNHLGCNTIIYNLQSPIAMSMWQYTLYISWSLYNPLLGHDTVFSAPCRCMTDEWPLLFKCRGSDPGHLLVFIFFRGRTFKLDLAF